VQKLRSARTIGSNIRALRKASGMTQEQVAAQLQLQGFEISRSIYSQIECGTHGIQVDQIIALKKLFKTTYDAIFEGLDEQLPEDQI